MERKIGEIFEYNGEWYQCVECEGCGECSLRTTECGSGTKSDLAYEMFGHCSKVTRSDNKHTIFKKLEKSGGQVTSKGRTFQCFNNSHTLCAGCVFNIPNKACDKYHYVDGPCPDNEIWVEINQNKEDMEEKKLNLKPFDLQKAREGKPVCTRGGRKARIICFDAKLTKTSNIVTLVEKEDGEEMIIFHHDDGHCNIGMDYDLMMLPEKKIGWINVYNRWIYNSEEDAREGITDDSDYVGTIKVEWEG